MSPLKPGGWKQYLPVPAWGEGFIAWETSQPGTFSLPYLSPAPLLPRDLQGPLLALQVHQTKQGKCAVNQALPRASQFHEQNKKKRLICFRSGLAAGAPSLSPHWMLLQTAPPTHSWQPSVSGAPSPQPHWGLGLSRKAAPSLCTAALQTYLRQPVITLEAASQGRSREDST